MTSAELSPLTKFLVSSFSLHLLYKPIMSWYMYQYHLLTITEVIFNRVLLIWYAWTKCLVFNPQYLQYFNFDSSVIELIKRSNCWKWTGWILYRPVFVKGNIKIILIVMPLNLRYECFSECFQREGRHLWKIAGSFWTCTVWSCTWSSRSEGVV